MSLTPAKLLRGLALLCILVAWAFLAHYGSTGESHPDFSAALATTPLVAIVVMLLWRVSNPLWMVLGSLAVLGLLALVWPQLRQNVALLYYVQHFGTKLALGTLFGRTLIGVSHLGVDEHDRLVRSGLISSQIIGLAMMRYVWKIEPVASMTDDEIVGAVGPSLQHYIQGDISVPT